MPTRRTTVQRRVPVTVPLPLLVGGVVAGALLLVPILALAVGVDISSLPALLTTPSARDALWLSLRTSALATGICCVLAVPLALVLTRSQFPGRSVARALVLLPLVLPPVVGGIALTEAFGKRGLIGQYLEVMGFSVSFSTAAVVMAQCFVALPFLVVALESSILQRGDSLERTAQSLGSSPMRTFFTVTLPLLGPGMVSGIVMTFARALGEFGATITFAGSMQGTTRTLPLQIYLERETDPEAAVALSMVLVVVAIVVIALAYTRRDTGKDS